MVMNKFRHMKKYISLPKKKTLLFIPKNKSYLLSVYVETSKVIINRMKPKIYELAK